MPGGPYRSGSILRSASVMTCLSWLAAPLAACAADSDEHVAARDWIRQERVPLDGCEPDRPFQDLANLESMVGDARVVLLGQSRHDAREQLLLQRRLFQYLVEEHGFTRLVLEESLPSARLLDEWVLGGPGDLEDLLQAQGAWYLWDTREVAGVLRWMRSWNTEPGRSRKLRVHGIDVTDPWLGVEEVLGWLCREEPDLRPEEMARALGMQLYGPDSWEQTLARHARLSPEESGRILRAWDSLMTSLEQRRAGLLTEGREDELETIRRLALVGRRAHELFRLAAAGRWQEAGDLRERAMADNLRWLQRELAAEEGLVVWAHDFHVAQDAFDLHQAGRPPLEQVVPMGQYLADGMDAPTLSVGFTFGGGAGRQGPLGPAPEGSLDALLAEVGDSCFLVDLRSLPPDSAARPWFESPRVLRGQDATATLVPARAFDALLFVQEVTPTRLSLTGQARWEQSQLD